MKALKYILIVLCSIIIVSCDDFLDEQPSKTTSLEPKRMEHLNAILDNYTNFATEANAALIYGTDDFGLNTDLFDGAKANAYRYSAVSHAVWDVNRSGSGSWTSEWKKIFTANMILENLKYVIDGSDADKAEIRAECHLIRSYSYFQLATTYCLPYTEANKGELGLPLKTSTSFEDDLTRANLKDTYAFIEADLIQALEIKRNFSKINASINNSWRGNTAAVNAFAARYYLSLNNYSKAQAFAQDALNEYNTLRDYNTEMYFSNVPASVTIFDPDPIQVDIKYPFTYDNQRGYEDRLGFGEMYYFRLFSNGAFNYLPSEELLELYDKNYDLRYKYHMVENYSYVLGATKPPYSYPGYIHFYRNHLPSGPSVSEMILTKAECQIRQGSFNEGMQTVNELRAKRMDANAPANVINLTANSKEEALLKVIEERRRELPFTLRWFDIRRYNNSEESTDNVTITRTFYPISSSSILGSEAPVNYTLEENSRRYAVPLPISEIEITDGVIKQNKY